jgi:hypothetical protein
MLLPIERLFKMSPTTLDRLSRRYQSQMDALSEDDNKRALYRGYLRAINITKARQAKFERFVANQS